MSPSPLIATVRSVFLAAVGESKTTMGSLPKSPVAFTESEIEPDAVGVQSADALPPVVGEHAARVTTSPAVTSMVVTMRKEAPFLSEVRSNTDAVFLNEL